MTDASPMTLASSATPHASRWRWWGPLFAVAIGTALLELGVYFLAGAAGATERRAVVATLAAATIWVALTAAPLAAGPHKGLDGLLRGGVVADTSGLVLLALWLMRTPLTLLAAVKVYCILGSLALVAITVVRLGRTRYGRACLAGIVAAVMMLAVSTPFSANGLIVSLDGSARTRAVTWCVRVNPFFAVADATSSSLDLIWHESPRLYAITELGDRVAAPRSHWGAFVVGMLIVTGIGLAVRLVRPPNVSRPRPDGPPAAP